MTTVNKADTDPLSELDLGEPPRELLQWAAENINEDPDTKCKVLEDFRDMIYSRGDCTPHRTDDDYLLRFLRCRSFNLEKSYKLLVRYYDFKEENPNFFKDVNLKKLQRLGEDNVITVPPYRDQNGRRILLYRMGMWDPKKYPVEELFQATMVILELAILEQRAQILGGNAIFDLGDLSMRQLWHLTPSVASKMVQIMVTCFPMKINAVHIVNQPWLFDAAFGVFGPFIDNRMRERIYFHGDNWDSLHRHIHPKHLPERYGGYHPDYNYGDWIDYFNRTEYVVNELKSLGYKQDIEDENKS